MYRGRSIKCYKNENTQVKYLRIVLTRQNVQCLHSISSIRGSFTIIWCHFSLTSCVCVCLCVLPSSTDFSFCQWPFWKAVTACSFINSPSIYGPHVSNTSRNLNGFTILEPEIKKHISQMEKTGQFSQQSMGGALKFTTKVDGCSYLHDRISQLPVTPVIESSSPSFCRRVIMLSVSKSYFVH